jgi:hypothetical protein
LHTLAARLDLFAGVPLTSLLAAWFAQEKKAVLPEDPVSE